MTVVSANSEDDRDGQLNGEQLTGFLQTRLYERSSHCGSLSVLWVQEAGVVWIMNTGCALHSVEAILFACTDVSKNICKKQSLIITVCYATGYHGTSWIWNKNIWQLKTHWRSHLINNSHKNNNKVTSSVAILWKVQSLSQCTTVHCTAKRTRYMLAKQRKNIQIYMKGWQRMWEGECTYMTWTSNAFSFLINYQFCFSH